jgi:peptidyl-prolyl cis-trans isomerase B (cyclophilin B)
MHQKSPHLDGQYASFGKVVEGIEIVDEIATTRTDYYDRPFDAVVMDKVTVDTFGVDYGEPEKY